MGNHDGISEDLSPSGAHECLKKYKPGLIGVLVGVAAVSLGLIVGYNFSGYHGYRLDHLLLMGKDHKITDERIFPLHKIAQPWSSVDFHQYQKIIVSGPQRSGTTYFTKALAEYLGYTHIDELDRDRVVAYGNTAIKISTSDDPFGMADLSSLSLMKTTEPYVAQRPQWSSILHLLPSKADLLIIFMARNCLDVFESQNKIMGEPGNTGWTCKFGRLMEWEQYNASELRECVDLRDLICTIKQQAMKNCQMQLMEERGLNLLVLDYESLKTFRGYVNTSARLRFGPKQVSDAGQR